MSLHTDIRAAVRTRLLSVVRATTGARTDITATSSGYQRAAGSFVTDGFLPGDEVLAAGFAAPGANGTAIVTAVSATALTVDRTVTAEGAGASVTIAAGIPQARAWEGIVFTPLAGVHWVRETLKATGSTVVGYGQAGEPLEEHTALAMVDLFFPITIATFAPGTAAIETLADAVREAFRPGNPITHNGRTVHIQKADRGPLLPDAQFVQCPVTIRLWTRTP